MVKALVYSTWLHSNILIYYQLITYCPQCLIHRLYYSMWCSKMVGLRACFVLVVVNNHITGIFYYACVLCEPKFLFHLRCTDIGLATSIANLIVLLKAPVSFKDLHTGKFRYLRARNYSRLFAHFSSCEFIVQRYICNMTLKCGVLEVLKQLFIAYYAHGFY